MDFLKTMDSHARDVDPDLRFMVASDLEKFLASRQSYLWSLYVRKIASVLVLLVQDPNPDVQNQAIKAFAPYGATPEANEAEEFVVLKLLDLIKDAKSSEFSAAPSTMALRSFLLHRPKILVLNRSMTELYTSIISQSVIKLLDWAELAQDLVLVAGKALDQEQQKRLALLLVHSVFSGSSTIGGKCIRALNQLASISDETGLVILDAVLDRETVQSYSHESVDKDALSVLYSITATKLPLLKQREPAISQVVLSNLFLDQLEVDYDESSKTDELRDIALGVLENMVPVTQLSLDALGIADRFLSYDSLNIQDDDDDDDDEDLDMSDGSEVDFSDDEYEEEAEIDDISWRLRKQAAGIVSAVVKTEACDWSHLFSITLPALLVRLKDKNDAVVAAVITLLADITHLTSQTEAFTAAISQIESALAKAISRVSDASPLVGFAASFVDAAGSRLPGPVVNQLLETSQKPGTDPDAILGLLAAVLRTHSALTIKDCLPRVIQLMVEAVTLGLRARALGTIPVALLLTANIAEHSLDAPLEYTIFVDAVAERASSKRYDSELRERYTLFIVEALHQVIVESAQSAWDALVVNAEYDSLSETVLSQLARLFAKKIANEVPETILVRFVETALKSVAQHRNEGILREALFVLRLVSTDKKLLNTLSSDKHVAILETVLLQPCSAPDLYAAKLDIVGLLLGHLNSANILLVEQLVDLVREAAFSDKATSKLVGLLASALAEKVDPKALFEELLKGNPWESLLLPDALATVAVEHNLVAKIAEFERGISEAQDDQQLVFVLRFLGSVGRVRKLDLDITVFVQMAQQYRENDAVFGSVVQALGKLVSRDVHYYLGFFKGEDLLLLSALRDELELSHKSLINLKILEGSSNIWERVASISATSDFQKSLALCAEILTYIVLSDNAYFDRLHRMVELVSEAQTFVVLSSVNLLLNQHFFADSNFLGSPELLTAIGKAFASEHLVFKQVGATLTLGILKKDNTLLSAIQDQLLESVLAELKPNSAYINKIQIGPFKHKVDDGVELRKLCYEILGFVTLESANEAVLKAILEKVVEFGLKDVGVIVVTATKLVLLICGKNKELLFGNDELLSRFIARSDKILNKKLGEKATAQQVDEHRENTKSVKLMVTTLKDYGDGEEWKALVEALQL